MNTAFEYTIIKGFYVKIQETLNFGNIKFLWQDFNKESRLHGALENSRKLSDNSPYKKFHKAVSLRKTSEIPRRDWRISKFY